MHEKDSHHKHNVFSEFLHLVKEYILIFAMLLAAVFYLSNNINKIPGELNWLKWIVSIVVIIIIISLYFFTVRPALLKKRELNLRPKGEPDKNYFTTSPRTDDKYDFFTSGYEQYVEWLMHPKSPILYLTGPSGSGKSSLINAYIAPQLEKRNPPKTNVYLLRSYHDPLKELYEALKIEENTNADINEESVFDIISKASKMLSPAEQILIVLDQFEEFFLLRNRPEDLLQGEEEMQDIEGLKKFFQRFIKNPPEGVYILLSYRDDFQQLIDQLELPARIEHINFKQVTLLTFGQASKFLKNCPGLEIPEKQLTRILREATSIDSPITLRPIVLNLLGIILQRMVDQQALPKKEGNLIRQYILNCLGKELREERATVLKAMLTDFNTARPRTLQELSKNSSLTISQLDNQMIAMHQHGLVRCLDTDETTQGKRKWQIAHDFVAMQLEKVVHGISKPVWRKAKPWIAPALICMLVVFSAFYFGNIDDWKKKKAIKRINKAGLVWNGYSKSISIGEYGKLSDSLFQLVLPDIIELQPDSLQISFSDDTTQHISSFDPSINVKSLKNIGIYNYNRIRNLEGLKGLTNLTVLSVGYCKNLQNVDGLKELKDLNNLEIDYCWNLEDIDGIKGMRTLTRLVLNDCISLRNLDALNGLTALTRLALTGRNDMQNADPLKGLKALTVLSLMSCTHIQNIDALKGLTALTILQLTGCDSLQNIDPLKELTVLTILDLSSCHGLRNVDALNGLTALTNLDLTGCSNLQNIDGLKGLTALTKLNLSRCDDLLNLDALNGLTALTNLNLTGCSNLQNIDGLKGLTALTNLYLNKCSNLQNVDALKSLSNLKAIDLRNSPKLKKSQIEELRLALPAAKILF